MKFVISIVFGALFCISTNLQAGSATGKVTHIFSGPGFGTKVFIAIDSEVMNKPSCQINTLYTFAFDSEVPGAKTWISMLHTAYATGKTIYIEGNNQCSHYSSIEDMKYLRLNPQ